MPQGMPRKSRFLILQLIEVVKFASLNAGPQLVVVYSTPFLTHIRDQTIHKPGRQIE